MHCFVFYSILFNIVHQVIDSDQMSLFLEIFHEYIMAEEREMMAVVGAKTKWTLRVASVTTKMFNIDEPSTLEKMIRTH